MSFKLSDVVYETRSFWVLGNGARGYEIYRKGIASSTFVGAVGNGPAPQLGLHRAKAECDRRQAADDAEFDERAKARSL